MEIRRGNKVLCDVWLKDTSYGTGDIHGADQLRVRFDTLEPVALEIGDYVDMDGERYAIRHPENVRKESGSLGHGYTVSFYGSRHELRDVAFFLGGKPERLRNRSTYTGNAREMLGLVVGNMNRDGSGWVVGDCIDTPRETFTLTDAQCSDVLDEVARRFETGYHVRNKTVSIGEWTLPCDGLTLGYGEGMGLTGIEVQALEDKPPLTVLYPYGGDRNLGPDYGSDYLLLPGKALSMERNVDRYGRKGRSVQFPHIFPRGEFKVTGKVDDLTLTASGIGFNLSDCLLDGVEATVTFQDGALAGYDLAIAAGSWDNATKRLRLVANTKENSLRVPGDINFAVGNSFILTGIKLPQSYIDDASRRLETEARAYLDKACERRVQLRATCDDILFRRMGLYIESGRMIHVVYDRLGLDREIRCVGVKRYLENGERPYRYELTLSDYAPSDTFKDMVDEVRRFPEELRRSETRGREYSERGYRDVMELQRRMYDPEGDFFNESIRPLTVQAMQVVSAAPSLQFRFMNGYGSWFTPPFTFDPGSGRFQAGGGRLVHMTLGLDTIKPAAARKISDYRSWDIAAYSNNSLDPARDYYLYARCPVSGTSGGYTLLVDSVGLDSEPGYHHLWVGHLSSEYEGRRSFRAVYGYTEMTGGNVTTDNIVSASGESYIRLVDNIIRLGDEKTYLDYRDGKLTLKGIVTQSPSGDTGLLPTFRGDYSKDIVYYPGDEVTYLGSMYRCVKQNSGSSLYLVIKEYWLVVAKSGTNGQNGTNGTNGINGTDGKDGQNGRDGLPGALPTTRQWSRGTVYYRNADRVDYIMYRASPTDTPTWWRLRDGYSTATAMDSPYSSSGFEQISSYEAIATMVLLANEANIANFIFKDGVLVSQNYVDNGKGVYLDGKAGIFRAFSGRVGAFEIEHEGHLISYNGNNSIWMRGPGNYPANRPLLKLEIDGSTIRLGKSTAIVDGKPQDDFILYVNSGLFAYIRNLKTGSLDTNAMRLTPSSIPSYSSTTWKPLYVNVSTGEVKYRD